MSQSCAGLGGIPLTNTGRARPDEPDEVLLAAENVAMHFPVRGGLLRTVQGHVMAVDGVSLQVRRGETVAVVGESGSGKTTLARLLLRLLDPSGGKVFFMGRDITTQRLRVVREERRHLQMVFQDPMSSLDPRMTIKNIVAEPLVVHEDRRRPGRTIAVLAILFVLGGFASVGLGGILLLDSAVLGPMGLSLSVDAVGMASVALLVLGVLGVAGGRGLWRLQGWASWFLAGVTVAQLVEWALLGVWIGVAAAAFLLGYLVLVRKRLRSGEEITRRVVALLELVGLKKEHLNRFPHEFSGGQRQRINIARALALNPDVIILDEPTSALDVSVQAQILNLLAELQERLGLTYLFITHDLSVVYHIADRVSVMYAGKIVELGDTEEIFREPLHPYTKALISAAPVADPKMKSERIVLEGEVPSPTHPPPGCRFHPRCWLAFDPCSKLEPELFDAGNGHRFACFATARDRGLWTSGTRNTPSAEQ